MSCVARLYWAIYPADQRKPGALELLRETVPNGIHGNDPAPTADAVDFTGKEIGTLAAGTDYKLAAVWYDGVNFTPVFETEFSTVAGGEATLVIQEATHSHTADNVTLAQVHSLTVQESTHGHAADNVTLVLESAAPVLSLPVFSNIDETTADVGCTVTFS